MDLNTANNAPRVSPRTGALTGLREGEVPEAASEALFRRALDEDVLWRGKPEVFRHAASAFHTNSVAIYFAILTAFAFATGGAGHAVTVAIMGLFAVAILFAMGVYSARHSAYVLTSHRLIILTGMIVDKRISLPLKRIGSAKLRPRSKGHGDIALELNAKSGLSYLLLWPHARFFIVGAPQPLLRAVPEAENVARMLADACAEYAPIDRAMDEAEAQDSNASKPQTKPHFEGVTA